MSRPNIYELVEYVYLEETGEQTPGWALMGPSSGGWKRSRLLPHMDESEALELATQIVEAIEKSREVNRG